MHPKDKGLALQLHAVVSLCHGALPVGVTGFRDD